MNLIKSLKSIFFEEGISNFVKRKKNKMFLDNRTLFTIDYKENKVKIFLNKKFGYVDQYIFDHGIYEKEIIDDICDHLTKEKTMLDIGSNIGQHSLILAPFCKQIFAFEPIPEIFEEFKKSINANHYKNITLQNFAIGNKKEKTFINYNSKNAGASSLVNQTQNSKQIPIQIDLLENVLPENLKFDVIKLDVEGYEAVVILSNKDILLKNRPVIFLEFSPSCIKNEGNYSADELIDFFLMNDFEIYSRRNQKTFRANLSELHVTDNWIVRPRNN
ncbi:FkbM family methyltransferase [Chryseobacterium sp. Leaf180]|uniref:FkbM family methyltransferase n=1 Tax=Chryseobacterium sp. Leaf180 TaxID=1736289 RepID=UPI000B16A738|nr:FkbM family methyltransferase [Chryseobacterium sp. Leaf180]